MTFPSNEVVASPVETLGGPAWLVAAIAREGRDPLAELASVARGEEAPDAQEESARLSSTRVPDVLMADWMSTLD
jgi:hypothetical protein